jgi:hypothetical protein
MTPIEIGIALGIAWAAILVVWSLADITTGEPNEWLLLFCCLYRGFDLTPRGIFLGAMWAFLDGCISGYVISRIIFWLI